MKTNRLVAVISAFVTSLVALFFIAAPHAFAATATWTGAGSDTNMNTAGNWGGVAPSVGDDLVFPANITNRTVVNNYAGGTSFNSITFSGTASQASDYTISGNAFVVVAGITNSINTSSINASQTFTAPITLGAAQTFTDGNHPLIITNLNTASYLLTLNVSDYLFLNGVVTGSGGITQTGTGGLFLESDNSAYTGPIVISAGYLRVDNSKALGAASAGTTIASAATINFCFLSADTTVTEPLTLNGNGTTPSITAAPSCGRGNGVASSVNTVLTLSGAVTLGSNVIFSGYTSDLKVSGTYTDNGHSFTVNAGTTGNLILPGGTVQSQMVTTNYADNTPLVPVIISTNNIGLVDGTYGDTFVVGGTIKGTGNLKSLDASNNSIVAPGHSPGTLTVRTILTLEDGSHYQAELFNKDSYDKIIVSDASTTTGHPVILGSTVDAGVTVTGNPVLDVSLYTGATIKATDTFTIIDNLSTVPVQGTFRGLPEGATFAVNGGVFKITYVGGTGNDVVLSVVKVPTVGNTGFKLLISNPINIGLATIALTAGAYVLSRRYLAPARTK